MQDCKNAAKEKARRKQEAMNKAEGERQKAAKSQNRDLHKYLKKKMDEHVARSAAAFVAAEKEKEETRIKAAQAMAQAE